MLLLNKIQQGLKAPKGQTNTFGNYKYRSCEDILEAIKPLLGESTLTVSDKIVLIGDRYYVEAIATLKEFLPDGTFQGEETTKAYAREAETKKGMDVSQITGSASSYARKYALNGLFCIDDTKDSDSTNEHGKSKTVTKKYKKTPYQDEPIKNTVNTANKAAESKEVSEAAPTGEKGNADKGRQKRAHILATQMWGKDAPDNLKEFLMVNFAKERTSALTQKEIEEAVKQLGDLAEDSGGDESDTVDELKKESDVNAADSENCVGCGTPVNGKVLDYSKKKLKKVLCYDCQKG